MKDNVAKSFKELHIYQRARELTNAVYALTREGDFSYDRGLVDQVRRVAVSIMSNVAEGFERGGTKEFAQFLSVAKGSSGEVRSQLYVALDQDYIQGEAFEHLFRLTTETSRMIAGLMSYLRKSKLKGSKYK